MAHTASTMTLTLTHLPTDCSLSSSIKSQLARMAAAGRKHVFAYHTRAAVARYMLKEIFEETSNADRFDGGEPAEVLRKFARGSNALLHAVPAPGRLTGGQCEDFHELEGGTN